MDAAAREMSDLFTELREVRLTLRRTLNAAQQLESKLLGPRPSSPEQNNKLPSESLRSLVGEISVLAACIEKATSHHHEIIGEHSAGCENVAPVPRFA